MRAALYGRVSTNEQDVEMQLEELRAYAPRRSLEIVREYTDRGVSGAKDRRPALDEMLADARRGRFDLVLVWKLDRLGRNLRHLLNVLEELSSEGVAFASATEPIDTSTPAGRMVLAVLGAAAELERSLIRERVKAGLAAARRRGRRLGRPRAVIDVEKVASMAAKGLSVRRIARALGVSPSTIARLREGCLKNPVASGCDEPSVSAPLAAASE